MGATENPGLKGQGEPGPEVVAHTLQVRHTSVLWSREESGSEMLRVQGRTDVPLAIPEGTVDTDPQGHLLALSAHPSRAP